ncbi:MULTISPECIES: hypothetical protein [unclassified Variovorax]|uniref:hypothetical protein n=1 Tax=unclassified Variovorax TaxID=663243 RepID=UPI0011AFA937|nr:MULTISPECIES: hypothetical protein [unclassified Variovorax]
MKTFVRLATTAVIVVLASLATADSIKNQKIIVVSVMTDSLSNEVKEKLTEMLRFSAEKCSIARPARLYIQGISEMAKGTLDEKIALVRAQRVQRYFIDNDDLSHLRTYIAVGSASADFLTRLDLSRTVSATRGAVIVQGIC